MFSKVCIVCHVWCKVQCNVQYTAKYTVYCIHIRTRELLQTKGYILLYIPCLILTLLYSLYYTVHHKSCTLQSSWPIFAQIPFILASVYITVYTVVYSAVYTVQGSVKYSVDYTVNYNLQEAGKRLLLREKVSSPSHSDV